MKRSDVEVEFRTMAHGELEQQFARFRELGDVAALGQVFDAAAPKLLVLARHLAPDVACAEDLVQATFLAAIEHCERFDGERGLLAWLGGILTNKARLARVLHARRVDPERLSEREPIDPALDVELREFVEALELALRRIPAKYRAVLRGHLADGKRPQELARELGREQTTVRVQLHRGLELLRKSLPPGFALGVVGSLTPRGLAAVRGEIVRHAHLAAIASGTASGVAAGAIANFGSWSSFVAYKLALSITAVVLVCAGFWFALALDSEQAAKTVIALEPPDRFEADAVSTSSARQVVSEPNSVSSGGSAQANPYGALDIEVAWHDGTAASNVGLEVTPRSESVPAHHATVVVTDELGRARIERLRSGVVHVAADSRATFDTVTTRVEPGVVTFLRIEVPRGVFVSGRVVDSEQRPVSGAKIWTLSAFERAGEEPARIGAVTSRDGSFVLRAVGPNANIYATAQGLGASSMTRVSSDAAAKDVEISLRLSGVTHRVTGVVRDARGEPAVDAIVSLYVCYDPNSSLPQPLAWMRDRSDASGRFAFDAPLDRTVELYVAARGAPIWNRQLVLGSDRHLDIDLETGVTVRGIVTDSHGSVVPGAWIAESIITEDMFQFRASRLRALLCVTQPDGSFELDGLRAPRFALRVSATIDGTNRAFQQILDAAPGAIIEWNPKFGDRPAISGLALDVLGGPLVGWSVQAIPLDRIESVLPRAVVTRVDGAFEILDLRDIDYTVELTQPGSRVWSARMNRVRPPQTDLRLIAEEVDLSPAFVRGVARDEFAAPIDGAIVVLKERREGLISQTSSDANGAFHIGPVQPGDFDLKLYGGDAPELELEVLGLRGSEGRDLGVIEVQRGGFIEAVIELEDGSTTEGVNALVVGRGTLAHKAASIYSTGPLPPGRYRVFVHATNAATEVRDIDVTAGATRKLEFRLAPGCSRVFVFRGHESAPMLGATRIIVRNRERAVVLDEQWDLSGQKSGILGTFIAGFAVGSYELEATAFDGRRVVHAFEIHASSDPWQTDSIDVP